MPSLQAHHVYHIKRGAEWLHRSHTLKDEDRNRKQGFGMETYRSADET